MFAAATVFCLLKVIGGQKTVDNGYFALCVKSGYAICDTLTNVIEVWSLAANHSTQKDYGIISNITA